jgi:hypothetical protein
METVKTEITSITKISLIEYLKKQKRIHQEILKIHTVCPKDYHKGAIEELDRIINTIEII